MMSLPFTRGAWIACALILLDAPAALAAPTSTTFEKTKLDLSGNGIHHASGSGIGISLVRTLVALAIVIGVIYGIGWIIRQSRAVRAPSVGETGLLQVASLPLGTNRAVTLVRVGDELHLLGVADHGVTGIRSFSEDEAFELGIPFDPPEDSSSGRGGRPPLQRVFDVFGRITGR